jgi:hypothetical protein
MRLAVRITRWRLVGLLLGCALLCAAVFVVPRSLHLLERAAYHTGKARAYSDEAIQLRALIASDPGFAYLDFKLESATQNISLHNELAGLYRRSAFVPWRSRSDQLPLPFPWDRARDRLVLRGALGDWLGPRMPRARNGGSEDSVQWVVFDSTASLDPFEEWDLPEALASAGFPPELFHDLQRRNPSAGEDIAALGEFESGVKFADLRRQQEKIRQVYPEAAAFAETTLPGYSADGRLAVVAFCSVLEAHAPCVAMVLARQGGRWRVIWSHGRTRR